MYTANDFTIGGYFTLEYPLIDFVKAKLMPGKLDVDPSVTFPLCVRVEGLLRGGLFVQCQWQGHIIQLETAKITNLVEET